MAIPPQIYFAAPYCLLHREETPTLCATRNGRRPDNNYNRSNLWRDVRELAGRNLDFVPLKCQTFRGCRVKGQLLLFKRRRRIRIDAFWTEKRRRNFPRDDRAQRLQHIVRIQILAAAAAAAAIPSGTRGIISLLLKFIRRGLFAWLPLIPFSAFTYNVRPSRLIDQNDDDISLFCCATY